MFELTLIESERLPYSFFAEKGNLVGAQSDLLGIAKILLQRLVRLLRCVMRCVCECTTYLFRILLHYLFIAAGETDGVWEAAEWGFKSTRHPTYSSGGHRCSATTLLLHIPMFCIHLTYIDVYSTLRPADAFLSKYERGGGGGQR